MTSDFNTELVTNQQFLRIRQSMANQFDRVLKYNSASMMRIEINAEIPD